jgi:hypothetical protein
MSYLGPLRLHFAGRFQASVSTVNNDPIHFDNTTFQPSFQELMAPNAMNGWWNPHGDADFRLIGCGVTSAFLADGSPAPVDDPVRQMLIADSDRAAPAKMADLDPCQQMVSMIFGLEVRIADATGATVARGAFEPAAFIDIWERAPGPFSDEGAGAYYQSVLTNVEWGDMGGSPFLHALRAASPDGILSIKFMVDGYNGQFGAPEFTRGRIVGTIGPGAAAEPRHLVRGRHLVAGQDGQLNACNAVVDEAGAKVYLDLGNALPTTAAGGDLANVGALSLQAGDETLCPVPYEPSAGWYAQTAGVVVLPSDRPLEAAELEQIAASPLSIVCAGQPAPAAVEASLFVRPDQFVFRCAPGDEATVSFYATNLGRPCANATVALQLNSDGLQPPAGPGGVSPAGWTVGVPESAVSFPASVSTDAAGVAVVSVATADPGWPRDYIDGQVYGISATLADDDGALANPWSFVSLRVFSGFEADDPVTWNGSLQPVFQQYANLYPIMQDFLDLSSYEDVCAHRELLLLAFGLDPADSNSMPVTRDLSSAKRKAILSWLGSPGPDGNPLLGNAPAAPRPRAYPPVPGGTELENLKVQLLGGKAAAFARRNSVRGATP